MNVKDIAHARELTKINHFLVAHFSLAWKHIESDNRLTRIKNTIHAPLLKIKPYKHVRQTVNETRLASQISSLFLSFVSPSHPNERKILHFALEKKKLWGYFSLQM